MVNEGRHQGGRAPYGYVTVDGGPHPNPRKAAEGDRLRVLRIDEPAAEVVRRIYADYLADAGDQAIASGLNRDGIPCPSACRPEQNQYRLADGWQGSTVRAILENPRYTGYAIFGRWTKQETFDPDDVSAGRVVWFKRAASDRVVRSRRPAHPAIVSVEDFTQAQLIRRSRGAGGMRGIAKLDRDRTTVKRTYLMRGRVRCCICTRKMQGGAIRDGVCYRCHARTLAPGSEALADHPKTVNLREDVVVRAVNGWIRRIFARENVDETVAAFLASQEGSTGATNVHDQVKRRLADAETRLKRHQAAIAAGVDPMALVEVINDAQAEREAARAELANVPSVQLVTDAEIHAMIDSLGDLEEVLREKRPARLAELYEKLGLELRFHPTEKAVYATAYPRVVNVCVRGRSCTLFTHLRLEQV